MKLFDSSMAASLKLSLLQHCVDLKLNEDERGSIKRDFYVNAHQFISIVKVWKCTNAHFKGYKRLSFQMLLDLISIIRPFGAPRRIVFFLCLASLSCHNWLKECLSLTLKVLPAERRRSNKYLDTLVYIIIIIEIVLIMIIMIVIIIIIIRTVIIVILIVMVGIVIANS